MIEAIVPGKSVECKVNGNYNEKIGQHFLKILAKYSEPEEGLIQ